MEFYSHFKPNIMKQHEIELRAMIHQVFPSMSRLRIKALVEYHFSMKSKTLKIAHHHAGTEFVTCLVAAHVRHNLTDYEAWFPEGYHTPELKQAARKAVQPVIAETLRAWSTPN